MCAVTAMLVLLSGSISLAASESSIPEPFRSHDPNSTLSINYDDLSMLWKKTVLVTGRSNRVSAARAVPAPGSRVVKTAKGRTANEGNRLDFSVFQDKANYQRLIELRKSLEIIPSQLPLRYLNKQEQLAYWLNLYTVTLVGQLSTIYPESRLKSAYRARRNNIWDAKILSVSGVQLSLNDIQFRILIPKFKNPAVIYGLWQGFIGGPNIRNEAYIGKEVWEQLHKNAVEFVNSNRGSKLQYNGKMRVSHIYDVNRALFPNFDADLRRHIRQFADTSYKMHIDQADRFSPTLKNWYIADLFNGHRGLASSANTNGAALFFAMESEVYSKVMQYERPTSARFPMHTLAFVKKIQEKLVQEREGTVRIEESSPE